MPLSTTLEPSRTAAIRHMLWIDGVGAFLVCEGDRVTVGGPPRGRDDADVPLLADLTTKHATFTRTAGGDWLLQGEAIVQHAGNPVDRRAPLRDEAEIALFRAGAPSRSPVRLRFRVPSARSTTARLDFASDHRPATSVDAVVLMDHDCLLGPEADCHIHCPDWPATVTLFRRDGEFHVKSSLPLFAPALGGARTMDDAGRIAPGQIVAGPDLCFRLEEMM